MSSRTVEFQQNGTVYQYESTVPGLEHVEVHRFTYGEEPPMIATLATENDGVVEVHGYGEHWTKDWVVVVWSDDNIRHCSCWIPAHDVRRPAEEEWHGHYVSR